MNKYKNDYLYGKQSENKNLRIIKDYFNDDIEMLNYRYAHYDFKSTKSNTIYELKTRRNNYNDYPTTIISNDKINDEYNNIFIFGFNNNQLYYIKYDKELFKKFEIKLFRRYDRCDKYDKEKEYIYIPIEFLTKII